MSRDAAAFGVRGCFLVLSCGGASAAPGTPGEFCSLEEAKLVSSGPGPEQRFGYSVAVSGDCAVVGSPSFGLLGAISLHDRAGSGWSHQQTIVPSTPSTFWEFGSSVSIDGDTVLAGNFRDAELGSTAGSAFVYVRSGSTWSQQAKLLAGDGDSGDGFGWSVSVSGDLALVGARNDELAGGGAVHGSAYVFARSGSSWQQEAKLQPLDLAWQFGWSVALSGETALVGAPWADGAANASGAAYVYVRQGTSWTLQAKLVPADGADLDHFGYSVALDGDTAVIGAFMDDECGDDSGSAYVYVRQGTSWTLQARLLASDGAHDDRFGHDVSVSGDVAVIGAPRDDGPKNAGSAYVFVREGTSWSERSRLRGGDTSSFHYSGWSVAVDGATVVVGSPEDDHAGTRAGSAYVFTAPAPLGSTYCACPAGPCGNGDAGAGCANSTGSGARLTAQGGTRPDGAHLVVTGARPGQFALFFQGESAIAIPFGDGYRCAGGAIVRITTPPVQIEPDGSARYGPCFGDAPISSVTGVVPGSGVARRYQFWYRDPGGPCGSSFNLSNGCEIVW